MKGLNCKEILKKTEKHLIIILTVILIITLFYIILRNINEDKENTISNIIEEKNESSNVVILIEIAQKKLTLIDKETKNTISTYTIASGKERSPTPLGTFQIIGKAHWGEGFGTRWLGLNVPWGIYGIHGTNKPGSIGSNVSAGCIRMRNADIEEIYDKIPLSTNVLITNGQYGPFGDGFRTLQPGDRGSDVLEVQKRLTQLGFYLGEIDGIYGESMKKSIIEFLKDKNLKLTDRIDEEIYEKMGIILMD
ncbi:MAG: L,D-transpeptidase family protein [Tissierella sp.]|uniref:L,D-transpeptidase family protein n=1 Tax=Tissierella sp. TaxID=41274 RepID=UPI003F983F36